MECLFIAPEVEGCAPLDTWTEIDEIGDMEGVSLEILAGPRVTRTRVSQRLNRPHDVVILAGHGEPGKFLVSDGSLTAHWLARYLKLSNPRVVLLAACHSAGRSASTLTSLAEEISGAGMPVIAMPTSVGDAAAVLYDVEFVRALVAGARVREAHRIALEQMETLSAATAMPLFLPAASNGVVEGLERVSSRFDHVEARFETLEAGLTSRHDSLTLRVDRVLAETGALTHRITGLESKVAEICGTLNGV